MRVILLILIICSNVSCQSINIDKSIIVFNSKNTEQHCISNIMDYNAVGDGIIDDTEAIQNAFYGTCHTILFPPNYNFKIRSTIIVPENITIIGYNSSISCQDTSITFFNLSSNTSIKGLTIIGSGNDICNTSNKGILIQGADANNYVRNINIIDCTIDSLSGSAIEVNFAKNVLIEKCKLSNLGYAGVLVKSGEYIDILNTNIENITPGSGSSSLAYGVSFTRVENDSLNLYPRTNNCSVINSVIKNIPSWEGLSTHSGEYLLFNNNIISDVKRGITITNSDNSSQQETFEPNNITITNNVISGLSTGSGIVVEGTEAVYAKNVMISNNILNNCGIDNNNINGGIVVYNTMGISILSNQLYNSYSNGIVLYNDNEEFIVSDNIITNVQTSVYPKPSGITVEAGNNKGIISNNMTYKENNSLNNFRSLIGIYFSINVNNSWIFVSDNYSTFDYETNGLNETNSY